MLTQRPRNAPPIADRDPRRHPAPFSAHRRFELLVALLVLIVAAVLVIEADPAAAQGPSFEAAQAEADGSPGFEASPATPAPADEVDPRHRFPLLGRHGYGDGFGAGETTRGRTPTRALQRWDRYS